MITRFRPKDLAISLGSENIFLVVSSKTGYRIPTAIGKSDGEVITIAGNGRGGGDKHDRWSAEHFRPVKNYDELWQ